MGTAANSGTSTALARWREASDMRTSALRARWGREVQVASPRSASRIHACPWRSGPRDGQGSS
eukprot:989851-Pleurochrysis_carterae.AAC.1